VIDVNNGVRFSGTTHQKQGNIGLSDGSVGQYATEPLRRAFRSAGQDATLALEDDRVGHAVRTRKSLKLRI
jgi:hypothetical protein